MSMQSFHTWLFELNRPPESSPERLETLTHIAPADMVALKSDLDWGAWGESIAAPSIA